MKFIYDLETYPNFFLASFKSIDTNEYYEFEISDRKSDIKILRSFLYQKGLKLIGFNNLNFDYPVLHNSILSNSRDWTAYDIYVQVEHIIRADYSSIWDREVKIKQLDLFKIWHYDNKNKSTSLKWLEFAMKMENVADLPYAPGTVLTSDEMDVIISYCRNDLDATHEFYKMSSKHISIRQFYTNQEGMNLMNASEIKMSKEIFGKYLAKAMNVSKKDLFKMRTHRDEFPVEDIIFDYIKFEDPNNIEVLNRFKAHIWRDTSDMTDSQKKACLFKYSTPYYNVKREFAEGGLHSFGEAGIYTSDEEWMIYDLDFNIAESRHLAKG